MRTSIALLFVLAGCDAVSRAPAGAAIPLEPGFYPDPLERTGTVYGTEPASRFGPRCAGTIERDPTLELTTAEGFTELHLLVRSEQDATLVVEHPDGHIECSDDDIALWPRVSTSVAKGTMRVWVGAYEREARYQLVVSEMSDAARIASERATAMVDSPRATIEQARNDIAALF